MGSSYIKLIFAAVGTMIGYIVSSMDVGFFGVPTYLAFCFIAVPLTVSVMGDFLRRREEEASLNLSSVLVSAFGFSLASYLTFLFSHFGLSAGTASEIFSYPFLGTIGSFFFLIYFTHFKLIRMLTKGRISSLSPSWSGYSMWLGFFLILNHKEINQLMFKSVEFSLDFPSLFLAYGGFIAPFVFLTPFLFLRSFRKKLENTSENQTNFRSDWMMFWLFVVIIYGLFYWINDFHYYLSCC